MRDVLLIEDNGAFRELLHEFLGGEGYRTVALGSRQDALPYVLRRRFHAIVMDYIDPSQLGVSDFVLRLRSQGPNRRTPIVVITALSYLPEALDVQALLPKPFDLHRLTETLCSLICPLPCDRPASSLTSVL